MEIYDIHCNDCDWSDEVQCDEAPKFCPQCGEGDLDWYII